MKIVALVSGGKDSCFNIMHCLANGHELVALANLYPPQEGEDELDSYMYQTVGHDILSLYSQCTGLPMYRQVINGKPQNQNLEYKLTLKDETEDLYLLLKQVKESHPDVEGVSVGAILSSYQRTRVEDVCSRLGLTSLAFLWQRDQGELMNEMCGSEMDARIVKVAAIGLDQSHLGLTLNEIHPTLINLNSKFGVHICGEGGEFETSVFDAPFFINGYIEIVSSEVVKHTNDNVWYLKMKVEFKPKPKPIVEDWSKHIEIPPIFSEKFQDISDFVTMDGLLELEKPTELQRIPNKYESFAYEDATKVFVSNIHSSKNTIEEKTIDIFEQLKSYLDEGSLTFTHIQSCKLLLQDMSNFVKVNSIYSQYFTNPLPPSRICVETNISNEIQLSVVVVRNLQKKSGLHIQGRSYWAPSNIGPYSQCVGHEEDLICRLSGQIPLIPSSMDLRMGDAKFNAILALQHYDNVKQLTGFNKNLLTVCFIKSSNYVPLVSKVFEEYMDFDDGKKAQLLIVQVTELPKGADVEWGGLAYKDSTELTYESDDEDDLNSSPIERITIEFTQKDQFHQLKQAKNKFHTLYTTSLPDSISGVEIVPVVALWDRTGKPYDMCLISQ